MNNSSCKNSATFTSHLNKAESVYNIHAVFYIFVSLSPVCKHYVRNTEFTDQFVRAYAVEG